MLVLTNDQISSLLSFNEVIVAVEAAMLSYENKTCLVPQRMHIDNGSNTLLCMPAFNNSFFSTKLVSVVPGNKDKKLQVTNGSLLLNDVLTGMPLALMNAEKLTALRTGAVGAMGVRYMTPVETDSFGLIGCGVQGLHQAVFACSVRPITTIYALDKMEVSVQQLVQFVQQYYPQVNIFSCNTAEELLSRTDVIIAATTSATPVLPDDAAMLEGKHFVSIGSYKPSMQELPDTVYRLSGQLAIDSEFARYETGDIINPIQKGILKAEDIYTIGKLITGERTINVNHTTVFKSAGLALFDLFTAQALYQKAMEKNIGTIIDF